jgi:hypothetical protein
MKNGFQIALLASILYLISFTNLQAQDEYNVAGGYGTPEMMNAGLRMRIDQNQVGINIGTNISYKHDNLSVSLDYYRHFSGRSAHTSLQPWYVKSGLTFMSNQGPWEKRTNLVLVPRLGREFNISSTFGVALEAGILVMLIDRNVARKERTGAVTGDLDLIGSEIIQTSAGFKIFYRLF